tara:strand:+ start:1107 stop:1682 length:576 start_codon:yes stop_codon:yes gene_type:complete
MTKIKEPIDSTELEQPTDNPSECLTTKVRQLEDQIQTLQDDLEKSKDKQMRLLADSTNRERQHQEKVKQTREYALTQFSEQLIHVLDALESGLSHIPQPADNQELTALKTGLDMTQKMLLKLLEDHGLKTINTQDCLFDAKVHEAIGTTCDSEQPNNWITDTIQKGYQLKDRLVRPARVIINQLTEKKQST